MSQERGKLIYCNKLHLIQDTVAALPIPSPVYLDTARLGRISPAALAIQTDYLRFSAKHGSSSKFQRLLVHGGTDWNAGLQREYPALSSWQGVGALKWRLCRIAGADVRSHVMLASRSQSLMELASYLLLQNCEAVVTVDLTWPRYQATVQEIAGRLGREVIEVRLREGIQRGDDEQAVIAKFVDAFRAAPSSSLFLPAISHDGIQLPVREIAAAVQSMGNLRFFVVDGAQHFAHGEVPVSAMDCDLYLAGTHKWLRGLYPLGVGVYGHSRSYELVETTLAKLSQAGLFADPLLQFTTQLQRHELDDVSETCNLSAMLSAYGAAGNARPSEERQEPLAIQLHNADEITSLAKECGWRAVCPNRGFRSGIVMLRPSHRLNWDCRRLRQHIEESRVIATTYDDLTVRLSMPRRRLTKQELAVVRRSLAGCQISAPLRQRIERRPPPPAGEPCYFATRFSNCRP